MENDELEKFYNFFRDYHKLHCDRVFGKRSSWKLRTFCYAATKFLKYSQNAVARAVNRDHTTIMHHLRNITDKDIEQAKELYKQYQITNKIYLFI